jgi:hypothetical protein
MNAGKLHGRENIVMKWAEIVDLWDESIEARS